MVCPNGHRCTDASNVASGALGTLVSAIGAVGSSLGTVGEIVLKATGLFVGMAGAIATGATVALGAFGSQLLKTADNFYKLEVSMFGALKSWEKVATVSKFSMEYAAKYPAMYGDVMRAMSGFAFIPKTKDMLMQGDIVKMKELMNIVQGLMTMRPEFPVQFAIMALRNAMAGQMRSLEFRYDIPLEAIARAGKTTIGKMKGDADVFISAMTGFMNEFVGEKTMEMAAKNVGTQIGNVKDKYDQWMNTLSQTGPYQAVVDMLLRLNSFLDSLAKSPAIASFTFMLGDALKGIAQGLEGIFTKGIDWGKIGESGEGLGAAVKQIAVNATEAFLLVWKSIKEPLYATLLEAFRIAAGIISEVVSEIFYPIGKELVQGIIRGIREELRTNPIANVLFIGAGAAAGAKVAGGWGALAGGAGAAFASLANQVSGPGPATPKENTEAIIGRIVEKWTRAAEVTNLRPRNETLEEFGQRFYKERQAQAVKEGAIPPPKKPTIFSQGIEERLSEYGLWSKMGMSLTQAEAAKERGGGEPQNAGYLFATGKIKEDEYFARRKIEDFQDKQLSKLEGMARDLGGEKKTKERFGKSVV